MKAKIDCRKYIQEINKIHGLDFVYDKELDSDIYLYIFIKNYYLDRWISLFKIIFKNNKSDLISFIDLLKNIDSISQKLLTYTKIVEIEIKNYISDIYFPKKANKKQKQYNDDFAAFCKADKHLNLMVERSGSIDQDILFAELTFGDLFSIILNISNKKTLYVSLPTFRGNSLRLCNPIRKLRNAVAHESYFVSLITKEIIDDIKNNWKFLFSNWELELIEKTFRYNKENTQV